MEEEYNPDTANIEPQIYLGPKGWRVKTHRWGEKDGKRILLNDDRPASDDEIRREREARGQH